MSENQVDLDNCPECQEEIKKYPRYDCPIMCDDGCIYGDDCKNGTPLPLNLGFIHSQFHIQEPIVL